MLDPKLSVLVRVDPHGQHLHLVVTGCLTAANQQGLHPVIDRARTLIPAAEVLVDLRSCAPVEPVAVELLRAGIVQQRTDRAGATVEIVLPDPQTVAATAPVQRPGAVRPGEDAAGSLVGRGTR